MNDVVRYDRKRASFFFHVIFFSFVFFWCYLASMRLCLECAVVFRNKCGAWIFTWAADTNRRCLSHKFIAGNKLWGHFSRTIFELFFLLILFRCARINSRVYNLQFNITHFESATIQRLNALRCSVFGSHWKPKLKCRIEKCVVKRIRTF